MVLDGYDEPDFAEEAKRRSPEIGLKAEDLHVGSLTKLAEMVDFYKVDGDYESEESDSSGDDAGHAYILERMKSPFATLLGALYQPAISDRESDDDEGDAFNNNGEDFVIHLCHYIRLYACENVEGLRSFEGDDASVIYDSERSCVRNTLAALKTQYDINPQEEYKGVLHYSSLHNALIGALECVLLNLSSDITMDKDRLLELERGSKEERVFEDDPEDWTRVMSVVDDSERLRQLSDFRMELIVDGERGDYLRVMPEKDR